MKVNDSLVITCIFCKIVKKEIKVFLIQETKNALAFLDIQPLSKGHSLVISKQHYSSFLTLSKEFLQENFELAQQITELLIKKLKPNGINILSNIGSLAFQSVFHFHVHIIPKYEHEKGFILLNNIETHQEDLNLVHEQLTVN